MLEAKKEHDFSIFGAWSFAPLCSVFPACWRSCSGNNSSFITARYQLFVLRHPPLLLSLEFLNFLVFILKKPLLHSPVYYISPLVSQIQIFSVLPPFSSTFPLISPPGSHSKRGKFILMAKQSWSSLKIYLNLNNIQGEDHLIQFFS